MTLLTPGLHAVPVTGGDLAVEVLPGTSRPVLAVHGIGSSRRLWDWLHAQAPDLTLITPDLRGRGDSVGVAGESSITQHAEDLVAVLDALELERIVVCGMSMGGFVAVELAARWPDRVESLVLVDGGYPMAAPHGLTRESLPVVFADRLRRLEHTWSSLEEYLGFFTRSTAPLLDPADPLLRRYLAHDLLNGRVRLSGDAVLSDAADIFFGAPRWDELTAPIRFVYAEWGSGTGSPPAYPAQAVARYAANAMTVRFLPGADHAASIMTKAGAGETAELLGEALA